MGIKIKNLYHASKYMKCTFKCIIQVYELAPPTCVQFWLIPLQYHFICLLPLSILLSLCISLPLCQQLAQKESSNFRWVGVKPCEMRIIFPIWFNLDHLQNIFNLVWSKGKLLVGAESDQLVNICSFAVRCDWRWPSTQWHRVYTGSGNVTYVQFESVGDFIPEPRCSKSTVGYKRDGER